MQCANSRLVLTVEPGRLAPHPARVLSHPTWLPQEVRKQNQMLPREPSPKLRDKGKAPQAPKPSPLGRREGGQRRLSHEQKTHLTHRLMLELAEYPRDQAGQIAVSPAKRGMDPSYKPDTWRRESVSSSRELHRPPLREQLRRMFVEGGFLEMTFGGSQGQWLAFSSCRQPCEEGPHPWASLLQRAQGSRLTFGDSKE